MPLTGYMKTKEPGRISSITTVDGDKARRKQIRPMEPGMKDPVYAMYVADCSVHEHGGVVVPVMLKRLVQGWGWEELGVAKCCPLCWRIITPPVGIDLPPAVERLAVESASPANGTAAQNSETSKAAPGKKGPPRGFEIQKMITSYLEGVMAADVYEIMALLECSRPTALRHLNRMIRTKKLEKEIGGGGGNKTMYWLIQKKEA